MRNWLVLVFTVGCAGPSVERRSAEEVVWRSLSAADVAERRTATRLVVELK